MQLSKSINVQRAGDIVGVVGGAASILLAMCTAELDVVKTSKPGREILTAFTENNQRRTIPDRVWRYMAADQQFVADMSKPLLAYTFSAVAPAPERKRLFSCRYNKLDDPKSVDLKKRLAEFEKKIGDMAQGMASLFDRLDN